MPLASPFLLHMVAPLNLAMERDTSFENIVAVKYESDEEKAKIDTDMTTENPTVVIIDETKAEEPKPLRSCSLFL